MSQILFPWAYIPDPTSGRPVALGQMYFGLPDLDPEVPGNQIQVRAKQEDGTLVDIGQPVDLNAGGVPTFGGFPVILDLVEGEFSWKVLNALGGQVYYQENNTPLIITGANIADNSISSDKIISLDGAKIVDGTITEDKLDFILPGNPPAPYSGGIPISPWNLITNPTIPPITQPEAINFNPSLLGFMVLNKASATVYEFDSVYELNRNPLSGAFITGKSLALGAQIASPTCHWMPLSGDFSVAGGDSGFVYQYTWATPWDPDTAFYSAISFDHTAQTGGVCHSLTLSEDFSHMYIGAGLFIYQYTLGLPGDISTAVLTGTIDLNAFLPAPFDFLPDGVVSWYRVDGGLLIDKESGEWFSFTVKVIKSPPWASLPAGQRNQQPFNTQGFTMKLSTPLDITTGTLRADNITIAPANVGAGAINNSTFIPFFGPPTYPLFIPYDTVAPWADRRMISDFDSPNGYTIIYVAYGTDDSQYFVTNNDPYTLIS